MTYSINKQQLLLSLFLLLPATTQCMEITNTITITPQPKNIQELLNKGDQLVFDIEKYYSAELINNHFITYRPNSRTTLQSPHGHIAGYLTYKQSKHAGFLSGCTNKTLLSVYKQYRHNNEYSFLGVATIAIKDLTSNQKLSYLEKKDFTQKLRACGFKPTPHDKELALADQWERWQSIIKKICLLRCANNDHTIFLSQIPLDVIQYISLFMLETEEALF
jgi:hypothetical protein